MNACWKTLLASGVAIAAIVIGAGGCDPYPGSTGTLPDNLTSDGSDGGVTTAEPLPGTSDDVLLNEAVVAQERGDLALAAERYEELERSGDPWFSWVGVSGQVAIYRQLGDWEAARTVTARATRERPELGSLLLIWDGDTAGLEEDFEKARALYEEAYEQGAILVDGVPVGRHALVQLSRVLLEAGRPGQAAEAHRRLLEEFHEYVDVEVTLARAVALDAVAAGVLPPQSLGGLLHDGVCSLDTPCVIASGGVETGDDAGAVSLGGLEAIRFVLDDRDRGLLEQSLGADMRAFAASAATFACSTPTASDGFVKPIAADTGNYGYKFLSYPDSTGGYHPGVDLNGSGDDCSLDFKSIAKGCVTDASSYPSTWGGATVQSYYNPDTWTHQYGHADRVYYSVGASVGRAATLGNIGSVGTKSCHLHHEVREADHPSTTDADYYSTSSVGDVGDWYQDPEPFIDAHRSYRWVLWADEGAFSYTGSWTMVTNVGDRDDLKYTATTSSTENYGRYNFTPKYTGTHELWAFVPWNYATSQKARTRLRKSDGTTLVDSSIDQSSRSDAWVKVGSTTLNGGHSYYVSVSSNTSESGKTVAIDDVLLILP